MTERTEAQRRADLLLDLSAIVTCLENGCNPEEEAKKLRLCVKAIRAALSGTATAPRREPATQDAFDAGWEMAAEWANLDDLISDMGSLAYIVGRADRLADELVETPFGSTRYEAAGELMRLQKALKGSHHAIRHALQYAPEGSQCERILRAALSGNAPGCAPLSLQQINAFAVPIADASYGMEGEVSEYYAFEPESLTSFVRAIEAAHGITGDAA